MDQTDYHTALIEFGTPEFDEALQLRNDVLRRPLGLVFSPEDIAAEFDQHHLGLYDANWRLVACLTLQQKDDKTMKMRQVAVAAPWQGRGLGARLVQGAEVFCRERSFSKIELNARDTAVPFYLGLYYEKVGEPFTEVGIKHYKMQKILS